MHDLTGQRFGRLVANSKVRIRRSSGRSVLHWECSCDCGKVMLAVTDWLVSGKVVSCGCYKSDMMKTHGKSGSREYTAYMSMITRCTKENCSVWFDYGGRGIGICSRWTDSFENFYEDMGDCPENYSLERLDVNGDYTPENCVWASQSTQMFNRRLQKNNTSGRTGVALNKAADRWFANIKVNRKVIRLGTFDSFDDAVKAREAAEIKYFGFVKE